DKLVLGNMDSKRDWGYAPEYVEGMWRILQAEKPSEYVLATHETHTVREFVQLAFARLGMDIDWQGSAENEKGICRQTGKVVVEVSPKYYRPTEVDFLLGDPAKAKKELGWAPQTTFKKLVEIMTDSDFRLAQTEAKLK
ncbi:MAG: GDP-mannose 4,6-dehydratase, partial [Opitutales bacterium]|nr:GDP-mannose 4,6-dehydratase [Opitutales bacterium]